MESKKFKIAKIIIGLILMAFSFVLFYHYTINKTIRQNIGHYLESEEKLLNKNQEEIEKDFIDIDGKVIYKRDAKPNEPWNKDVEEFHLFEFYNNGLFYTSKKHKNIKISTERIQDVVIDKRGIVSRLRHAKDVTTFYTTISELVKKGKDFALYKLVDEGYLLIGDNAKKTLLLTVDVLETITGLK